MVKFALLQTPGISAKLSVEEARQTAYHHVRTYFAKAKAADSQIDVLVLPEMFGQPYGISYFGKFAEKVPVRGEPISQTESPTAFFLSNLAKESNVWLVGGSISEGDAGKVYNTSMVFDNEGNIVARHRKLHLFDIDVPGKIRFFESETLSPGNEITSFTTPWGVFGLGICYDIRFPEYAMALRQRGANVLLYPGAFNSTTGPAHWQHLITARAMDNQSFVIGCSPSCVAVDINDNVLEPEQGAYPSHGHSMIVDPWAVKLAEVDSNEPGFVVHELNLPRAEEVRSSIPISTQRRYDVYHFGEVKNQNQQQ